MRFYSSNFSKKAYPCIVFRKSNWDDYNHKITFDVSYDINYSIQKPLGEIKILSKDTQSTELPQEFSNLNTSMISLGVSLDYYANLKAYFPEEEIKEILTNLNDIGFNKTLRKNFESLEGYEKGLLRFSSSELILDKIESYILENRLDIENLKSFQFSVKLDEADDKHIVKFNYDRKTIDYLWEKDEFPFRINAIIGKNGTGKTQYLTKMIKSLAGIENKDGFTPSIPLFNKVIAISYSLFDSFPKPDENNAFSYKYIGFRASETETLSDTALNTKLKSNLNKIIDLKRTGNFTNALKDVIDLNYLGLQSESKLTKEWVNEFIADNTKRLSSGQSILIYIFTELIAEIQPKSFVIFDEPETHLHPEATSVLIESLYSILEEYNSYAVISTHSPYFLQNIPSDYIHVFERIGNTPNVINLHIETFGTDITEISNQVYNTINVTDYYKKIFDKISLSFAGKSRADILFGKELSFNAKLYLNLKKND